MSLVAPHGGSLVNRILSADAAEKAKAQAKGLAQVTLSPREQGDWELLAVGGFSPLKGFMGQKDFTRVCNEMRLADGTVWPIPVILSPADDVTAKISVGDTIALNDSNGQLLGTMKVTEKYPPRQDSGKQGLRHRRRQAPRHRRHRQAGFVQPCRRHRRGQHQQRSGVR